ncbi:hypothetical protein V2J09_007763 [Rumex salicifolius]
MRSELLFLLIILVAVKVEADPPIARQGCIDHCGNVSIPFPFGIGAGCFLDEWFEIECKPSSSPAGATKPYLSKFNNMEIMALTENYHNRIMVGIPPLNICATETRQQQKSSIDLRGSPFAFGRANLLMAEGCSGNAVLRDQRNRVTAGCGTVCGGSRQPRVNSSCYGECCQTMLFTDVYYGPDFEFYHIDIYPQDSSSSSSGGGRNRSCLVATLINSGVANQYVGKLLSSDPAPVTLTWRWISESGADENSYAVCTRLDGSLRCYCGGNSFGNAYVSNGCQVPHQCKHCRGECEQKFDYRTNIPIVPNSYICIKRPLKLATIIGLSISLGVVLVVIGLYGLYRFVKRRREIRRRARFFKRNGGLLLHQQLSSNNEGVADGTKIFTIGELDKATDHFNENRILGQGGQGTVYKGMLVDGRIVAIKKAKLLDESQLEQFINEVVILSQVNHRNVVKLLGCCLETEVPLLVYEFVPNGTLFQHIHDPEEDFAISWEKRLKIVLDSAGAIAYLHSSSSIPIYHRDIKSSNILLDERHRAKVSDFGSSKTIAIDQTHLTTLVQGTMGYLDPEYFQSYQFTDKSDVYSFGVVLLELLTSKKPIYRDASSTEQKNLVIEFSSLMEQSALSSILDPEVAREAKEDELLAVVELARCCINRSGKLRPTMKEVAMTLEMIIKSPAQVSTLFQQQEASGFAENTLPAAALSPLYTELKPHKLETV